MSSSKAVTIMATRSVAAQQWLKRDFAVASPVEEMVKRSKLAASTFKLRFVSATGLKTIIYVQRFGSRRPSADSSGRSSVDEIGWQVGYEEAAFFRRVF